MSNPLKPLVVAIDMGYGHLRPAHAIAERLAVPVHDVDRPPLATSQDAALWMWVRRYYEGLSRASQYPLVGPPVRAVLNAITDIGSLYSVRDQSSANLGAHVLEKMIRRGLGKSLVEHLERENAILVTTFYMPAVAADRLGYPHIYCIVTDSDIHRVWAPVDPANTRITYLVPTQRTRRRLRAYGVPPERIQVTGFPLPHELVGGTSLSALKRNLARRLVRLDPTGTFCGDQRHGIQLFLGELPEPPETPEAVHLTYAVGGAGAQVGLVQEFLPSLRALIADGRLKVSLVAGIRQEVADELTKCVREVGMGRQLEPGGGLQVLVRESFADYLQAFNALLADTDVLWTKPSEMTFFAGLGLPIIFSWPVGTHERYNRRWAMEAGAGMKQRELRYTAEWFKDWLKDGTLAAAAWAGFTRLPQFGLYQVIEAITSGQSGAGQERPVRDGVASRTEWLGS